MPRDAAAAQKSKKDILMVALLGYWSSVQVVGDTNLMDVILDDVLRRSEGGRGREVKIWRGGGQLADFLRQASWGNTLLS